MPPVGDIVLVASAISAPSEQITATKEELYMNKTNNSGIDPDSPGSLKDHQWCIVISHIFPSIHIYQCWVKPQLGSKPHLGLPYYQKGHNQFLLSVRLWYIQSIINGDTTALC